MDKDRAITVAWWIGTILIVLDWVDVVPNRVGWFGFIIAIAAIIAQIIRNRR